MQTSILSLNAEALALIFARVMAEADAKHTQAYGVCAPPWLALVCRGFRDVVLGTRERRRVLCVPLLGADGAAPLFRTREEWAAYFDRFGDAAGSIRLLSSPAGPFDATAHLTIVSIPPPMNEWSPNLTLAWALQLCVEGMPRLYWDKVTLVELRMVLSMAITVPFRDAPYNELCASMRGFLRDAPNLRRVVTRIAVVAAPALTSATQRRLLLSSQDSTFYESFAVAAEGIHQRAAPLDELRVEYENPTEGAFDDYILHFIAVAARHSTGPTISMFRCYNNAPRWLFASTPTPAEYPVRVRRVVLPDFSHCEDAPNLLIGVLSMLCLEALELTGPATARRFRPNLLRLNGETFPTEAARQTPMRLLTRVEDARWSVARRPWFSVSAAP